MRRCSKHLIEIADTLAIADFQTLENLADRVANLAVRQFQNNEASAKTSHCRFLLLAPLATNVFDEHFADVTAKSKQCCANRLDTQFVTVKTANYFIHKGQTLR